MGSFLKRKKMKKIGCTLLAALLGTAVANAALIGEYTFNDTGSGSTEQRMAAAMGSSSVAAGMNSFNHYAYGAIGQWMYERVAGLAPDPAHPGYKHFFVRPVVGGPLTRANAELETAYGKASSGWKKVDGKLIMGVTVPPNTTATIEFPNGRKSETVPAGNYRFEIKTDFVNPPSDTRPGCYWYWINDNISKEGITKDLEAMARVGIGRAYIGHIYNYKAESNNPVDKTPVGDVAFMSDAWWEAVQWAVKEADRCGVEIGFFNSPGWSQSGGPWVAPSQTMRYLDGSETIIKGGRRIERQLPIPEIKTYPESRSTQAVQIGDLFTENDFQDVGVIAFRQPASEALDLDMSQIKLSSPGIKSLTNLFDGSQETSVEIEKQEVIDFVLDKSVVLQSLRLDPLSQLYTVDIVVEHSEDGNIYRELAKYSEERGFQGPRRKDPILVPFPATNAKYLRVKISANKAVSFSEIALSRRAVLANYIRKQLGDLSPSSRPQWNAYAWKGQDILVADSLLNSTEMIDLSDKMDASGRLVWDAPEGNWVVMRLGMVPIGTVCAPASPESRGLEVDKMSREHIRSSFDGMVGEFLRRTPASERKALKYVIADSYETGPQNWTDGMTEKFEKRFGYSPLRFLPCLTGRVVDNPKISNRFLWDWRHLVAESIAEDYVGGLRDVGAENGLTLWLENYGHWGYASEFLLYGKYSDQVGGEFWENNDPVENVECRAAASCSHIYGRKDVYAEAFTSNRNFKQSPASIKSWCDWVYGAGVNHLILHVYIHQPEEETPGIIQWFGMAFNRHNTWFEQSKGFLDYTRRCSVMLKAGLPVIDVAYYIGENSPVMQGPRNPEIPDGYDFDYINSDVLINNATVKNGKIIIPGGLEYSVLVLPKQSIMRPQVVEAINRLIQTGATVLGPKPETSPSLENYPACDESVGKISGVIWGNVDGEKIKIRKHGKGFISDGMSLEEIFARQGLEPDISVISGDGLVCAAAGAGNKIGIGKKGGIVFKHRRTMEGDVYFLSNTSEKPVDFTASFRITGRKPALWNAVTGAIDNVDAFVQKDGRTLIPLHLEASESVFVVFEGLISKAATGTAESNEPVYQTTAELNGDWTVIFNGQNPPQKIHFDKLTDWTEHSNEEIKYYAGTAAYQKSFMLPESAANKPVVLELGKVGVIADVVVNGKEVGIVWTAPWEIDISEFISMGKNELEIRVTNVWNNRLIADSNLTGEKRQTYVSQPYRFTESDPLIKSGLLGPVRIKVKR